MTVLDFDYAVLKAATKNDAFIDFLTWWLAQFIYFGIAGLFVFMMYIGLRMMWWGFFGSDFTKGQFIPAYVKNGDRMDKYFVYNDQWKNSFDITPTTIEIRVITVQNSTCICGSIIWILDQLQRPYMPFRTCLHKRFAAYLYGMGEKQNRPAGIHDKKTS